jgi:hypothetical protein
MTNNPFPARRTALRRIGGFVRTLFLAVWHRLLAAIRFWILQFLTPDAKFARQLALFAALAFTCIELWRSYGFHSMAGAPLLIQPLLVPSLLFLVYHPVQLSLRSRTARALSFVPYSVAVAVIIQWRYSTPGIISNVWYVIIACLLAITYYLNRAGDLNDILQTILASKAHAASARQALSLLAERCRFYLDRWILAILSIGAALGVMMTILWGNSYGAFLGTRAQKVTDAVYMVLAFSFVILMTAIWIAFPIHEIYTRTERGALNIDLPQAAA